MIVARINALDKFLETEDGASLLAGYKRATNILKAEEKKDGAGAFEAHPQANLRIEHQEHALAAALDRADREVAEKLKAEDFDGAMHALSKLRAPVDEFFDQVTVNSENADLRKNRLQLLAQLRRAMHLVADFSKVGGATGPSLFSPARGEGVLPTALGSKRAPSQIGTLPNLPLVTPVKPNKR